MTTQKPQDFSTATPASDVIHIAVVGAHLTGMALNPQLTSLGGTLVAETKTAPLYRLFELPGTTPRKPGLLRVGAEAGASVIVEVWALPPAGFGSFVAAIPQPLGIGTLDLEDGSQVKGFLVEEIAVRVAQDITGHGGWRAWIAASA